MNTQEIQDQLQDNQELTIKLGERINLAEETLSKLAEIKDYSGQLNELKELITKNAEQDKSLVLQEEIRQQVAATQNLSATVKQIMQRQETVFKDFPKELKVKLLHRFEDKTKGFIIGGLTLFTVLAALIGICLHLWSDNDRMKDNDVKFRMVRQIAPDVAYKADTLYYSDPVRMENKTKQLEAQQISIAKAEAKAKQVAQEAEKAKQKAKRLKKRKSSL